MSATSDSGTLQTIDLADCTLGYRMAGGTGAAVVYLHGLGLPRWAPALDELARRYTIYAPELPGCGRSTAGPALRTAQQAADVFGAFIRALVPEQRAHVVGSSEGATLALWLASQQPDVVERLVLAAPTIAESDGAPLPYRLSASERRTRLYAHPERLAGLVLDETEVLDGAAVERLYGAGSSSGALLERLSTVEAPVLALFGTRDAVVPTEMPSQYRARLRHCHVVFVYNAGHALHVDRPDAFVRLADDFLAEGEGFFRNRGATGYMRVPAGRSPTGATWSTSTRPRAHSVSTELGEGDIAHDT